MKSAKTVVFMFFAHYRRIEPMEKIEYEITPPDGKTWMTDDADIARTAIAKGFQVVEHREYATYSEYTVVRVQVTTQLTTK